MPRWWTDPTAQTKALTAVLAVAGITLAVSAPSQPLIPTEVGSWTLPLVGALTLAFFLTELGQAPIEVGRQAYSFSLSGVPLLLGVLYFPPGALIAARVGGAIAAFIVQRAPPIKASYNSASYLLDAGAVLALVHLLVGAPADLTLRTALLCYVSLAIIDLVMSSLVLAVIRINGGLLGRDDVTEVLVSASIFVAINTTVGFIFAILLGAGPLGVVLLAGFAAATTAAFQAYLVLRRKHHSLVEIQGFIDMGEGAPSVEDLAERMLPRVREILHATRAELTVRDPDGAGATVLAVDESGTMSVDPHGHQVLDEFLAACIRSEGPLLLTGHYHERTGRHWLEARGIGDALIVPLKHFETRATIAVLDRLGDSTHFTRDDLALLQTLASHLAVELHGVRLFERRLHDANHDALTGLPNRSLLTANLKALLGRADTPGRPAVLLLDLDRFKDVNDTLGHDIGDNLLKVVANHVRELVPTGATVGRLGGDEFAVLLPASPDAAQAAVALAEEIAAALRAPVQLPDVTVSTEGSIGVAVAVEGQSDTDLMRHADTAMYAAKDSGLGVVVYTEKLDRGRSKRLSLLTDLRAALDRGELEVHFQPQGELTSKVVSSVEALVRWNHPTLGQLEPNGFIPLAESTGLIDALTRVVLATSLEQCRQWRDAGRDIAVAVNLSARNVNDPALPDKVAAALASAGVPAHRLILEITESSIMGDPIRTLPTLERLAALGVVLSIDDFGTGYSSLAYLQRLPVGELKIDRSFVLGLARSADVGAGPVLVRTIIELGHSLGLRIVAEGVENAFLLGQLRALGCDLAQGFFLSRPAPAAELLDAIDRAELVLAGPTSAASS